LFKSNPELGFIVETRNKPVTGEFKYKLFLKQPIYNQDEEFDRLNLITLKPVRIRPFIEDCGSYCAYATVGDDKVLLLSAEKNKKKLLQVVLTQTKGMHKPVQ
jgi:hypothetical protein